jgi:hypothetical protein
MEIPVLSLAYIMGMVFLVGASFFLIPRIAPFVLTAVASILLGAVGYLHYKQFGVSEYERNTWMDKLKDLSPYVLFGLIFVIIVGVYYGSSMFQSQENLPMPMPQVGGWLKTLLR